MRLRRHLCRDVMCDRMPAERIGEQCGKGRAGSADGGKIVDLPFLGQFVGLAAGLKNRPGRYPVVIRAGRGRDPGRMRPGNLCRGIGKRADDAIAVQLRLYPCERNASHDRDDQLALGVDLHGGKVARPHRDENDIRIVDQKLVVMRPCRAGEEAGARAAAGQIQTVRGDRTAVQQALHDGLAQPSAPSDDAKSQIGQSRHLLSFRYGRAA